MDMQAYVLLENSVAIGVSKWGPRATFFYPSYPSAGQTHVVRPTSFPEIVEIYVHGTYRAAISPTKKVVSFYLPARIEEIVREQITMTPVTTKAESMCTAVHNSILSKFKS